MTNFKCPVCNENFVENQTNYVCENNHSFDKSKSGYINLLLKNGKKNHGDNKLMVKARHEFLTKGYYEPLGKKLCDILKKYAFDNCCILDCGCGEGYYNTFMNRENTKINANIFSFDISKEAVDIASKNNKQVKYAVASSFNIPIQDNSVDILTCIFSPLCLDEFARVLKLNGIMIMVIPLENHLYELKEKIYDNPYKNEVADTEITNYELVEKNTVIYEINLDNNEDIQNLFKMTPYYYKTGEQDQEKLNEITHLTTKLEFGVLIYKLKNKI